MNTRIALPAVVLIAAAACLVYAPFLGYSPPYLAHDEVFFGLNGHQIASTARDINGRWLPLYFQWPPHTQPDVWFQPIPVYFTALFLTVLPVSEWAIRLPTVVLGLTDIVLVYLVATRVFNRPLLAAIAAGLLALTPAHLIHSRLAMDFLYPLPFVMAWLLCLMAFVERRRPWLLFGATTLLGIGFYSYIAAIAMMPVYFGMTCVVVWALCERPARPLGMAALGFVWPLLPLIPWATAHWAAIADTLGRYGLYNGTHPHADALSTVTSLPFLAAVVERLSVYWRFFDPSYLFVAGGGYAVNTTHRVGVFLLPIMFCLAIGINQIVNVRRSWVTLLILCGFLTAPLAASVIGEPYAVQRELLVLPFAILIATIGVEQLISAKHRTMRIAGWCLLAAVPVQFAVFYVDYFTAYRARSAFAFNGNLRGAAEALIDRSPNGDGRALYLSTDIRFVDLYWRFYLAKYRREDLSDRTVYFDPRTTDPQAIPDQSLVLTPGGATSIRPGTALRTVSVIENIDRTVCCEVLEKLERRAASP